MRLVPLEAVVATVWGSAVCIAGVAENLSSLSGWTVFAGVAVFPPIVMLWRWNDAPRRMSEPIQEARR